MECHLEQPQPSVTTRRPFTGHHGQLRLLRPASARTRVSAPAGILLRWLALLLLVSLSPLRAAAWVRPLANWWQADALAQLADEDEISVPASQIVAQITRALASGIKLGPHDLSRLYLMRARAKFRMGRYDDASHDYELAGKASQSLVPAALCYARACVAAGYPRVAVAALKSLSRRFPNEPELHMQLAATYYSMESHVNECLATACLNSAGRAVTMSPRDPRGYFFRAAANLWLGRIQAAVADADKCIGLGYGAGSPKAIEPHLLRATALLTLGDPRGALRDYLSARQLDSNSFRAQFGLWRAYFGLGRYAACERIARQMHADNSERAQFAATALAVTMAAVGQTTEASALLDGTFVSPPDDPDLLCLTGNVHVMAGNYRAALADIDRGLSLWPDYLSLRAAKAYVLCACPDKTIRDGALATRLADSCCRETNFQNPCLLMLLAMAKADSGVFGEALAFARRALARVAPGSPLKAEYERRFKLFAQNRPFRLRPGVGSADLPDF